MEELRLSNDVMIPRIGIGTWQITDKELLGSIISAGVDMGYRLVDTAAAYGNELGIGRLMKNQPEMREKLFLSDKVWNTERGYEEVQAACRRTLGKLKTDYLDCYLIHWPASRKLYENCDEINAETWRGMEQLLSDGLVRSIGVCNFSVEQLEKLRESASVFPMLLQIERHPGMNRDAVVEYANEHGMVMEASSPLGNGQILENEKLKSIARAHNASVAQICLAWGKQKGIVIPKTTSAERLKQNMEAMEIILSADEMTRIDEIPYCGGVGIEEEWQLES